MDYHIVIPARYASERLPGKALRMIDQDPLIAHVYRQASLSRASSVTVATDDSRIMDYCVTNGMSCLMTSSLHQSGSDRIAECIDQLNLNDDDWVVNLQGDEPLTPAPVIDRLAETLNDERATMSTVVIALAGVDEMFDPNCVKVVLDHDGFALYFSRAPIPWARDSFSLAQQQTGSSSTTELSCNERYDLDWHQFYRHVGLYAYRAGTIRAFSRLKPCDLEKIEKLEQLRMLYYGHRIKVLCLNEAFPAGVDTLEDLQRVTEIIRKRGKINQ